MTNDNISRCIGKILFLILVFSFSSPRVWGQSGSWDEVGNQEDYSASGTTITIANAKQLAKLAAVVNGGPDFSTVTIELSGNIDLSAHYWVPIGTAAHPFNGTFNGNNKTVSGLNINDGSLDNAGLFGYASGATIRNLTVTAGSIAGDENVGVLAGSLISSTISDCSVSATSISGTRNVSALVGYCDRVSGITSCTVTGTTAVSLANNTDNNSTLSGCQNKPCDVTLSDRTLYNDGNWNTICLPFDYDPAYGVLAGDGVEIYTLTSANIDGTRLNLFFGENVAGNGVMRAGTPYIIQWTSGSNLTSPIFQGVVPRVTAPVDYDNGMSGDAHVRFRGTFSPQALPAADKRASQDTDILVSNDRACAYRQVADSCASGIAEQSDIVKRPIVDVQPRNGMATATKCPIKRMRSGSYRHPVVGTQVNICCQVYGESG